MKNVIGVTGSMGCGKSYACEQLLYEGAVHGIELGYINVDSIRRVIHGTFSSYSPDVEKALKKELGRMSGLVLVEWARLVEDGLMPLVDNNVLFVKCDYDRQIERLVGGDLPLGEIEKRIKSQLSNDEKEQRIREIQKVNVGKLYIFDTTQNPSKEQYARLLETIIGGLR